MANTLENLEKALASEKEARAKAESKAETLEKELKAKDSLLETATSDNEKLTEDVKAALELVDEMKSEVDSKPTAKQDNSFTFKKKDYLCLIPSFKGIPGHPGRAFSKADLEENVVKVAVKSDDKTKEISLVEYLIQINSSVIKTK